LSLAGCSSRVLTLLCSSTLIGVYRLLQSSAGQRGRFEFQVQDVSKAPTLSLD
jgi:hypothetical protein